MRQCRIVVGSVAPEHRQLQSPFTLHRSVARRLVAAESTDHRHDIVGEIGDRTTCCRRVGAPRAGGKTGDQGQQHRQEDVLFHMRPPSYGLGPTHTTVTEGSSIRQAGGRWAARRRQRQGNLRFRQGICLILEARMAGTTSVLLSLCAEVNAITRHATANLCEKKNRSIEQNLRQRVPRWGCCFRRIISVILTGHAVLAGFFRRALRGRGDVPCGSERAGRSTCGVAITRRNVSDGTIATSLVAPDALLCVADRCHASGRSRPARCGCLVPFGGIRRSAAVSARCVGCRRGPRRQLVQRAGRSPVRGLVCGRPDAAVRAARDGAGTCNLADDVPDSRPGTHCRKRHESYISERNK